MRKGMDEAELLNTTVTGGASQQFDFHPFLPIPCHLTSEDHHTNAVKPCSSTAKSVDVRQGNMGISNLAQWKFGRDGPSRRGK